LDTVDNRYRFGALPGDAGVLSSLYGESVSRNQTLPPYKASPAELKKQKPIVAEMVDESVLFTHSVAATQALATLVEQTQVLNFGNMDVWILIVWLLCLYTFELMASIHTSIFTFFTFLVISFQLSHIFFSITINILLHC
jgi:hypothetical protein